MIFLKDASGNPVTQSVVGVTDASGNPVTGYIYTLTFKCINICLKYYLFLEVNKVM